VHGSVRREVVRFGDDRAFVAPEDGTEEQAGEGAGVEHDNLICRDLSLQQTRVAFVSERGGDDQDVLDAADRLRDVGGHLVQLEAAVDQTGRLDRLGLEEVAESVFELRHLEHVDGEAACGEVRGHRVRAVASSEDGNSLVHRGVAFRHRVRAAVVCEHLDGAYRCAA
jgi:hypothetical protein